MASFFFSDPDPVTDGEVLDEEENTNDLQNEEIIYPKVRRDETKINNYHGVQVPNPYEYLEDSNREDTAAFVDEQNRLFETFVSKSPSRSLIRKRLMEVKNCRITGVPMKKGSRIFFWENSGLQNHRVLYVKEFVDGPAKVLLDPNTLNKYGLLSVNNIGISINGRLVAYSLSELGSDWATIKIRDVHCGHDLDDSLRFTKLSGMVWTLDSKGFFYQRFPPPLNGYSKPTGTEIGVNTNAKVYYHVVGTVQDDDIVSIEFPEHPKWTIYTDLSFDGKYLFVYASDVVGEKYAYFAEISDGLENMKLKPLFTKPGHHWYLANDETTAYFVTDVEAPNSHVVKVNLANPNEKWEVLIPSEPSKAITWATVVHQNKLVICYLSSVLSKIEVRDLKTGAVIHERLPIQDGTASGIYGRRTDDHLYIFVESYVNPGTVYKVDFSGSRTQVTVHSNTVVKNVDLSQLKMVTGLTYSSNDGTNIPVTLLHRKNIELDSNRPCILTAYGGYGAMKLPKFSCSYAMFALNFDGVVAVANIRGGGEYGKSWWNDGKLFNKQNSFDDFIAGARFLKHNGYTRPELLTIEGNSNGGLLIGAVCNQRPDLFAAAIPQVGIMDMLRFHKFTIGHLWISEFGNPEEESHFENLKKYSPLHNIKIPKENIKYPAILATTGDHDDRVVPSHTYKYIAEMQHTLESSNKHPILLRVSSQTGHGYGTPTSKWIEERTDIFAFLELTLGYKYHD